MNGFSHTLKNAAIPIITMTGDEAASLLNGAVVIETLFGWPGVGILLIQAIQNRDLPLVEATAITITVMIIVLNLLVDHTHSLLDPRVRYQRAPPPPSRLRSEPVGDPREQPVHRAEPAKHSRAVAPNLPYVLVPEGHAGSHLEVRPMTNLPHRSSSGRGGPITRRRFIQAVGAVGGVTPIPTIGQ